MNQGTSTALRQTVNHALDRFVRPECRILRWEKSTFQVCGYTGLALAVLLDVVLATLQGLSALVMTSIVLASIFTFLALAMITKILRGKETLVYYHHEIAIITSVAILLWFWNQPLLPYLDLTILGLGTFLLCGRVGCMMVGCCHGKPSQWGVCYRREHVSVGFPSFYVGIRLFPIQAVEGLWVLGLVLSGIGLVLSSSAPGTALACYLIAYNVGRFGFEFWRGDTTRPYCWGFSQAQWISVLLSCLVAFAEWRGWIPLQPWHAIVTAFLAMAMVVLALRSHFQQITPQALLLPRHMGEVARATVRRDPLCTDPPVTLTSLGIRLSTGHIQLARGRLSHYALSWQEGHLSEETVRRLARFILQLTHPSGMVHILRGRDGIFHLLVQPGQELTSEGKLAAELDHLSTGAQPQSEGAGT